MLIRRCLTVDQQARPSAGQLLNDVQGKLKQFHPRKFELAQIKPTEDKYARLKNEETLRAQIQAERPADQAFTDDVEDDRLGEPVPAEPEQRVFALHELLAGQWRATNELQSKLENARQMLQHSDGQLEKERHLVQDLTAERERLSSLVVGLEKTLADEREQFQRERGMLENELAEVRREMADRLDSQRAELQGRIDSVEQSRRDIEARLAALDRAREKEVADLKAAHTEEVRLLNERLDEMTKSRNTEQAGRARQEAVVAEVTRERGELLDQLKKANETLEEERRRQQRELDDSRRNKETERSTLQKRLEEVTSARQEDDLKFGRERAAWELERVRREGEMSLQVRELSQLKQAKSELEARNASLCSDLAAEHVRAEQGGRLQSEIDELRRFHQESERKWKEERTGLSAELEELRKARSPLDQERANKTRVEAVSGEDGNEAELRIAYGVLKLREKDYLKRIDDETARNRELESQLTSERFRAGQLERAVGAGDPQRFVDLCEAEYARRVNFATTQLHKDMEDLVRTNVELQQKVSDLEKDERQRRAWSSGQRDDAKHKGKR